MTEFLWSLVAVYAFGAGFFFMFSFFLGIGTGHTVCQPPPGFIKTLAKEWRHDQQHVLGVLYYSLLVGLLWPFVLVKMLMP